MGLHIPVGQKGLLSVHGMHCKFLKVRLDELFLPGNFGI